MTIGVEVEGLDKAIRFLELFPRETERAQIRAVNRGVQSARTAGARAIAKDMGLKVGDARDQLKMELARPAQPEARLRASRKRIPLIRFKGTTGPEPSRGKGRVKSGLKGGKRAIPGAFIATPRRRGVFRRLGKGRGPITELHGPSIYRVAKKKIAEMKARGREVAAKELLRLLRREVGRSRVG